MAIKHVIVVMFENRSYDNVLGDLGDARLDGIPSGASNPGGQTGPISAHNQTAMTAVGSGPTYAATTIPNVDPGEFFADMAQQMIGLTAVPTSSSAAPWSHYSPDSPQAMTGYVQNYSQLGGDLNLMFLAQSAPPPGNLRDVMNFFSPEQLPVSAFLARNYGVCDRWFASVPTQTYPNRSFALCAAPGVTGGVSFIDDAQYFKLHDLTVELAPIQELPSILSQLDQVLGATGTPGPFWKVYFHDYSITFDTLPYVRSKATSASNINVATFDNADWQGATPTQFGATGAVTSTFVEDLNNGKLTPFSFIEPRYFDNYAPTSLPPNSNHPGTAKKPLVFSGTQAPIDAATGEVFLLQLYNMLRKSPQWDDMLLIVTYDEPGGIWDHVPPPAAKPPGDGVPPAQFDDDPAATGFDYSVLGGRVPAIVISSQIAPGSVVHAKTSFDHTSIIKTVRDAFLPPGTTGLNARDDAAPSVLASLTATEPNPTGFFEGQIVAGPQSLYFEYPLKDGPQSIFASAGPGYPLGVSATPDGQWLSFSVTGPPTALTIAVQATASGFEHDDTFYGTLNIFSTGATAAANSPVKIPVQFHVIVHV